MKLAAPVSAGSSKMYGESETSIFSGGGAKYRIITVDAGRGERSGFGAHRP